jgi:large subunit ribosomal protein L10
VERAEKAEFVGMLNDVFATSGVVVVAQNAGLNVAELTSLRRRMRDAGGKVKVVKNRLAKLGLRGTKAESIADLFKGPTLIAYSSDPVAAPKVATDFAKANEKLVILGGAMGSTALKPDGVKALAALPSLDQLRAKIVGMIQTPATRVVQVISAPASQLARVIGAHAEKNKAA